MLRQFAARIVVALALAAGGSTASAWGWWDHCDGPYCLGPPYGNAEPPPVYVYDHQHGPTWTGNGWANLPIGEYRPRPGEHGPHLPPPGYRGDNGRDRPWYRRLLGDW